MNEIEDMNHKIMSIELIAGIIVMMLAIGFSYLFYKLGDIDFIYVGLIGCIGGLFLTIVFVYYEIKYYLSKRKYNKKLKQSDIGIK